MQRESPAGAACVSQLDQFFTVHSSRTGACVRGRVKEDERMLMPAILKRTCGTAGQFEFRNDCAGPCASCLRPRSALHSVFQKARATRARTRFRSSPFRARQRYSCRVVRANGLRAPGSIQAAITTSSSLQSTLLLKMARVRLRPANHRGLPHPTAAVRVAGDHLPAAIPFRTEPARVTERALACPNTCVRTWLALPTTNDYRRLQHENHESERSPTAPRR